MSGTRFIFLFVIAFLLPSCDKEKCSCNNSEIIGKWEIVDFISLESIAYTKNNNYNPRFEFKTNGTFHLVLDVNVCNGNYALADGNTMNCSTAGCTEMCCDSPFSEKVVAMLPRVASYDFLDSELQLKVPDWGWINLKRSSD